MISQFELISWFLVPIPHFVLGVPALVRNLLFTSSNITSHLKSFMQDTTLRSENDPLPQCQFEANIAQHVFYMRNSGKDGVRICH